MDTDNPNLNNANHDRKEWWEAKKDEHVARVEKMDAEKRMETNDGFNNLSEEFDAAGDWTEATWDQFKAKVEGWWNKGEVKTDEAI